MSALVIILAAVAAGRIPEGFNACLQLRFRP
jgi:hypothetical protein